MLCFHLQHHMLLPTSKQKFCAIQVTRWLPNMRNFLLMKPSIFHTLIQYGAAPPLKSICLELFTLPPSLSLSFSISLSLSIFLIHTSISGHIAPFHTNHGDSDHFSFLKSFKRICTSLYHFHVTCSPSALRLHMSYGDTARRGQQFVAQQAHRH